MANGLYYVDDMPGATDDDKFANALAGARNSNGFTGTVIFGNRSYTLTKSVALRNGDQISGLPGSADEVRSVGNKNRINCKQIGPVFTLPANFTHSIYIGGLQWNGTKDTTWMNGVAGVGLQTSHFRDMGFSNFKSVFGTKEQSLEMTACTLDGWWNINASKDTAVNIGGSDNNLFMDGALIDSGPDNLSFLGEKFQVRMTWNEAGVVGPIYVTHEVNSGVRIDSYGAGSTKLANLIFQPGSRVAGRNPNQPAYGASWYINGGVGSIRDGFTGNSMSNPSATGRDDAAVMHVRAGQWLIDGMTYQRAATVGEDVPFLYVGPAAEVRVRNIRRSGVWSGLPKVIGTGKISADDSVEVLSGIPGA
jgi:hypothetical protein